MTDSKYKQIKSFVIDRTTWYRGEGDQVSRLVRFDGDMCCLGFWGEASGIDEETMYDVGHIEACVSREEMPWAFNGLGGDVFTELYFVNDDSSISDAERELRITKWFKENLDTDVTFIN